MGGHKVSIKGNKNKFDIEATFNVPTLKRLTWYFNPNVGGSNPSTPKPLKYYTCDQSAFILLLKTAMGERLMLGTQYTPLLVEEQRADISTPASFTVWNYKVSGLMIQRPGVIQPPYHELLV
jgi:hypothetical protein